MSYDPIAECYVCQSKRVTARWSLCPRCQASYARKGWMSDAIWAAGRARMFENARIMKTKNGLR